jgi:tRNA pseudouridine38-40 synthase
MNHGFVRACRETQKSKHENASVNIKLTIEYDGTHYHGWQIQPNGDTIQAILERALATFFGATIRVFGSGRTDAGVHALGQVANFSCDHDPDLHRLQRGLNALTPKDIVVKRAEIVPDAFDARRHARSRVYQYRIWNDPWSSPFQMSYAWHIHEPLEFNSMRHAISFLEGEHDFSSFQGTGCEAAHAVRRIHRNSLDRQGTLILYTVEATAFLRHMVRNIVGTLVEVGRGQRSSASFADLLKARNRAQAGPTAPANGLFLMEVKYY